MVLAGLGLSPVALEGGFGERQSEQGGGGERDGDGVGWWGRRPSGWREMAIGVGGVAAVLVDELLRLGWVGSRGGGGLRVAQRELPTAGGGSLGWGRG
jgi:hypothetical protein